MKCGLLPEIREVFTITQIGRVFEIHASVEDALAERHAASNRQRLARLILVELLPDW